VAINALSVPAPNCFDNDQGFATSRDRPDQSADAYNLFQKHEPLVERALRFEVDERVLADGEIFRPLKGRRVPETGASSKP
jgi:N-methylhydantoinase A/oxoprolinase/acetone carboxylase beta subunit